MRVISRAVGEAFYHHATWQRAGGYARDVTFVWPARAGRLLVGDLVRPCDGGPVYEVMDVCGEGLLREVEVTRV